MHKNVKDLKSEREQIVNPEPLKPDTDSDGIYDGTEIGLSSPQGQNTTIDDSIGYRFFYPDKDPTSSTDPNDIDTDNDGLNDNVEDTNRDGAVEPYYETDPTLKDTDGDGLYDGWDDTNENGSWEVGETKGEANYGTKPLWCDTDGDDLWDGDEIDQANINKDGIPNAKINSIWCNSNATNIDSDDDGASDYVEIKGWPVTTYYEPFYEIITSYDVFSDPEVVNTDNSDLSDYFEFIHGCDPMKDDTDGDLANDNNEVSLDTRPCGRDGTPPELKNFGLKFISIVGNYEDGILYLKGWEVNVTGELTDPQYPEYLDVEIAGESFPREYLQHSYLDRVQSKITDGIDYCENLVTEGTEMIVEAADSIGNVIESVAVDISALPAYGLEVLEAIDNGVSPYIYETGKTIGDIISPTLGPTFGELSEKGFDTAVELADIMLVETKEVSDSTLVTIQQARSVSQGVCDKVVDKFQDTWHDTMDEARANVEASFELIRAGIALTKVMINELLELYTSPSGMEWGIHLHKYDTLSLMEKGMNHTKTLGANYIRIDIEWRKIQPKEPTDGDPKWDETNITWYHDIINLAKKKDKDLKIIAVLFKPPDWFYKLPTLEDQLAKWEEYCGKVAREYGDRVDHYQMWNEENHPANARISITKIKIGDKTKTIGNTPICIALAPQYFERGSKALKKHDEKGNGEVYTIVNIWTDSVIGMMPLNWYEILDCWCDAAGDYIDILAIDHYPSTWNIGGPPNWLPLIKLLSKVNSKSDSCYGKTAAIMETGYSTYIGGDIHYSYKEMSQQIFIDYQLEVMKLIVKYNNYVKTYKMEIACWYTLIDSTPGFPPREYYFGILHKDWDGIDWSRKLGYYDLEEMIDKF